MIKIDGFIWSSIYVWYRDAILNTIIIIIISSIGTSDIIIIYTINQLLESESILKPDCINGIGFGN